MKSSPQEASLAGEASPEIGIRLQGSYSQLQLALESPEKLWNSQ